jgi:uncharacterized membrane protein
VPILNIVARVVAYIGAAIIVWGALLGMVGFLRGETARLRGSADTATNETVRLRFGSYLLLGLEFLIAADIMKTVFEPTLTDVAVLGGIVVIRTVISFFLNRDIAAACRPGS